MLSATLTCAPPGRTGGARTAFLHSHLRAGRSSAPGLIAALSSANTSCRPVVNRSATRPSGPCSLRSPPRSFPVSPVLRRLPLVAALVVSRRPGHRRLLRAGGEARDLRLEIARGRAAQHRDRAAVAGNRHLPRFVNPPGESEVDSRPRSELRSPPPQGASALGRPCGALSRAFHPCGSSATCRRARAWRRDRRPDSRPRRRACGRRPRGTRRRPDRD